MLSGWGEANRSMCMPSWVSRVAKIVSRLSANRRNPVIPARVKHSSPGRVLFPSGGAGVNEDSRLNWQIGCRIPRAATRRLQRRPVHAHADPIAPRPCQHGAFAARIAAQAEDAGGRRASRLPDDARGRGLHSRLHERLHRPAPTGCASVCPRTTGRSMPVWPGFPRIST